MWISKKIPREIRLGGIRMWLLYICTSKASTRTFSCYIISIPRALTRSTTTKPLCLLNWPIVWPVQLHTFKFQPQLHKEKYQSAFLPLSNGHCHDTAASLALQPFTRDEWVLMIPCVQPWPSVNKVSDGYSQLSLRGGGGVALCGTSSHLNFLSRHP